MDTHDFALDFTAYHVGEAYSYPRFLCYACHAPQPVEVWNPYHRTCRGYRVVIHNDAYYYPAGRYRGDRVVFPRPPERGLPQFGFQERGPADPGTPLVVNRPGRTAPARALGVRTDGGELDDGFPTIRDGIGPTDGSDLPIGSLPVVGGEPSDDAVRTRPILQRRPPR